MRAIAPFQSLYLLFLFLLPFKTQTTNLPTTIHDFRPEQIPGVYTNIRLREGSGICPDAIRITRTEPLVTARGVLYVIAHQFIELPITGGGVQPCTSNAVNSNITSVSSTVLRRDTEVRLDESNILINTFQRANERFYLGFELGDRVCGRLILSGGSVSMWVAPRSLISVTIGGFQINFKPGSKYIYYFSDSDQACLFKGNANQIGTVTTAATVSPPSVSPLPPSPLPSPSGIPAVDTSTPVTQDGGGVVNNNPVDDIGDPQFEGEFETESEPVCFPADAMVWVKGGGRKRMDEVIVGDKIGVNGGGDGNGNGVEFSTVFGFTHKTRWIRSRFVRISLENGKKVEASKGHYVLVGKGEVVRRAEDVEVGDEMWDVIDGVVKVVNVERVMKIGLYNPQTMDGRIVVNDLVVTTYTDVVGEMVTAHALLTVVRWMQSRLFSLQKLASVLT